MTSAPGLLSPAPPDAAVIEQAVLRTVAYGDVFEYPLRDSEVHRYLHGVRATAEATAAALARCSTPGGALTHRNGYYTLRGRDGLVDVRHARAVNAARLWPAAVRYGGVIAGLPFVRMVAVTGSLAWDNIELGGDIDYLIVTEPDHLWMCRWLVAALGRLVRLRGAVLCPNYLVSTRALLLAEPNLYGAYELVRMTPIVGRRMYRRLRGANAWAAGYLPNAIETPRPPDVDARSGCGIGNRVIARLRRLGERVLRSGAGAALERYEMRYRIHKRFKQGLAQGEASYSLDWYRGHSSGHRQRTLAAFTERLQRLEGGRIWGGAS